MGEVVNFTVQATKNIGFSKKYTETGDRADRETVVPAIRAGSKKATLR